jgi:hypothetical protein
MYNGNQSRHTGDVIEQKGVFLKVWRTCKVVAWDSSKASFCAKHSRSCRTQCYIHTYIHVSVQIFHTDHDDMLEDLEQGDVAETVRVFFERSQHLHPAKKSTLSLQDVSVHNAKLKSWVSSESKGAATGRNLEVSHRNRGAQVTVNRKMRICYRLPNNTHFPCLLWMVVTLLQPPPPPLRIHTLNTP